MGGDRPPQELFEVVLSSAAHLSNVRFIVLVQDKYRFSHQIPPHSLIEIIKVKETIAMDDAPLYAVRKKKLSSMAQGIELVKNKKADAFITTGNTGALVALSMLHLPRCQGIEKPALVVSLPTEKGEVVVVDVGAHIAFTPRHIVDYARLGVAYRQVVDQIPLPSVGLLNIGVEEAKGTKEVKEAYNALLTTFGKQFVGNIEGREVFQGKVEVLVTDGFTGNVFLKTCEGASAFLLEYMQKYFTMMPISGGEKLLNHFQQRFNYSAQRGALLCGVEGIVMKCHGNSSNSAFANAIQRAIDLATQQVSDRLSAQLKEQRIE